MGLKESKAAKPKVEIEQPKSSPSIPVSSTVRIAVLGEPGSGKSSFVRRYVKSKFVQGVDAELEKEFRKPNITAVATKPSSSNGNSNKQKYTFELIITDTASSFNAKVPTAESSTAQLKFKGISNQFMTVDTHDGFILCCSPLKRSTFESLPHYIEFITTVKDTTSWPMVIVMTHFDTDQSSWEVKPSEIEALARAHDLHFFEISNKTGFNVENAFNAIMEAVVNIFTEENT